MNFLFKILRFLMGMFKISKPGVDVQDASSSETILDNLRSSPKIDTTAIPPHAGVIELEWTTSGIIVPYGETRVLYSIPHGYDHLPTAIGLFTSVTQGAGRLPFEIGAIGVLILDADSVNVNLKYFSSDLVGTTVIPPFSLTIRYYIFAERGHE
jgi:hypothetical protein